LSAKLTKMRPGHRTHVLNDARAYDVGLSDDAGGGNPLGFASKVKAAPTQLEASRVDDYIKYTLYGVKTDTAKPPYKALQIIDPADPAANCHPDCPATATAGKTNGIRMTMLYYTNGADDCPESDKVAGFCSTTSGHFDWNYTECAKCDRPFGGPTWCMTENMANATYRYDLRNISMLIRKGLTEIYLRF
jgi:hypothetical protein